MEAIRGDVGADHHMMLATGRPGSGEDVRIISSNWAFDAVQEIGHGLLGRLAEAPVSAMRCPQANIWHARSDQGRAAMLCRREIDALGQWDHLELSSSRLRAGTETYCIVFSAGSVGALRGEALPGALMKLAYALSSLAHLLMPELPDDPLSERERECLYWVSEGKTTEEVATIVGVSGHTVNGYLAQAIRKLGCRNRPMAIAAAIRGGII